MATHEHCLSCSRGSWCSLRCLCCVLVVVRSFSSVVAAITSILFSSLLSSKNTTQTASLQYIWHLFPIIPDSAHAPPEGNPCLYMHLHTLRKVLDHASTRRTPLLVYTHPRQVSMPHQQWLVSSLRITDVSVVDSFLVPNPAQLTVDLLEFSLLSSTHLHCVQFSHKEDCWDKP